MSRDKQPQTFDKNKPGSLQNRTSPPPESRALQASGENHRGQAAACTARPGASPPCLGLTAEAGRAPPALPTPTPAAGAGPGRAGAARPGEGGGPTARRGCGASPAGPRGEERRLPAAHRPLGPLGSGTGRARPPARGTPPAAGPSGRGGSAARLPSPPTARSRSGCLAAAPCPPRRRYLSAAGGARSYDRRRRRRPLPSPCPPSQDGGAERAQPRARQRPPRPAPSSRPGSSSLSFVQPLSPVQPPGPIEPPGPVQPPASPVQAPLSPKWRRWGSPKPAGVCPLSVRPPAGLFSPLPPRGCVRPPGDVWRRKGLRGAQQSPASPPVVAALAR